MFSQSADNEKEQEKPVEKNIDTKLPENDKFLPINFTFKISCIQRKLDNMYLDRRDH